MCRSISGCMMGMWEYMCMYDGYMGICECMMGVFGCMYDVYMGLYVCV